MIWERHFRCWLHIGKRMGEQYRWRVVVQRIRDGTTYKKVVIGTWHDAVAVSDILMTEMGI